MKSIKQDDQISLVKAAEYAIDIAAHFDSDLIQSIGSDKMLQKLFRHLFDDFDNAENISDLLFNAVIQRHVKPLKMIAVKCDRTFSSQLVMITLK